MLRFAYRYIGSFILALHLVVMLTPSSALADLDDICLRCFNFINTIFRPAPAEDIEKYRKSWNPFAAGPMLNPAIDIQPKGQTVIHPYVFGQVGHEIFTNTFGPTTRDSPFHQGTAYGLLPYEYGITDSLEGVVALSWVDWFATQQNGNPNSVKNANGLGDTSLFLKHRFIVQDPDSWRPTVTWFHGWVLPSSKWAGTTPVPGGFAPIGRLPSTRFGDQTFTEGVMLRKNLQPFRIMGALYYSYATPGSSGGHHEYTGDLINWRLMFEHVLDDSKGFGYLLEFIGLHGLGWRLDGHGLNVNAPTSVLNPAHTPVFNVVGVQPTIEYKFSNNIVVAGGVLFTPFGQNNLDAFYPNFTIYYYWGSKGRPVIMR